MNAYHGGANRKQKIKRIIEKSICKDLQQQKRQQSQRGNLTTLPLVGGVALGQYLYKKSKTE